MVACLFDFLGVNDPIFSGESSVAFRALCDYFSFFNPGSDDQFRRQDCEGREMRGCLLSSHERCFTFAREICDPVYANMRIAVPGSPIEIRFSGRPKVSTHDEVPSLATSPGNSEPANLDQKSFRLPRTTFRARELMQHEHRVDFRKRIAYWTSPKHSREGTLESSPKEGRVGGLVHPASRDGPLQPEMENPASKGPIYIASEWLQELQRSVMKKLSS